MTCARCFDFETAFSHLLQWLERLSYNSEGVLYEDEQLQIGVKAEYHGNLGRIALYLGNKIAQPFTSFSAEVECPDPEALSVQFHKPPAGEVPGLEQAQYLLQLECKAMFSSLPLVRISFIAGTVRNLVLRLPIFLTRFIEPVELDAAAFFGRWKVIGGECGIRCPLFTILISQCTPRTAKRGTAHLSNSANIGWCRGPGPELQGSGRSKIVSVRWGRSKPTKCELRSTCRLHFSLTDIVFVSSSLLACFIRQLGKCETQATLTPIATSLTPPNAFLCSGILVRVEPNRDAKLARITVRTTNDAVSAEVLRILCQPLNLETMAS